MFVNSHVNETYMYTTINQRVSMETKVRTEKNIYLSPSNKHVMLVSLEKTSVGVTTVTKCRWGVCSECLVCAYVSAFTHIERHNDNYEDFKL